MTCLEIKLLGPFQVSLDEERITQFGADTARALLAYLALQPQTAWPRDTLAGLLWPERSDAEARRNLRVALSRLRAAIGDEEADPPFLLINRQTIQFNRDSDHTVDARLFVEAVAATRVHRHRQLERCAVCAERLQEAARLYRGDLLAGFFLPSALFEDWLLVEREALHQQALDVLHTLAAYHQGRAGYEQTIAYARRQVELEPWREAAHRQWMRALAASGQRAAALAQYEACGRILEDELGVEPGPDTRRLYDDIRDGAEMQAALPERPHNLPAQMTVFVGRKPLLVQITELLLDPACRLLTLVGPGGSGKTRLALQVSRDLVSASDADILADGIFFVPLASLRAGQSIVPALAQALGFSFEGDRDPKQQMLGYLRHKQMLLILDNVEQLLVAASQTASGEDLSPMYAATGVKELVLEILSTAPQVKVLATSRIALNVESEQLLPVAGMRYPTALSETAPDADQYSAVRLFLARAHRARPGYAPDAEGLAGIAEVCRLVQGMPLGILLAAAWIKVLHPAEIATEVRRSIDFLEADLHDLPPRQRGMRAVYDYSWRLLSPHEREICAGLSLFRGGFTREAADHVVGASLRDLMALVDRSLLQHSSTGRYTMHELLRKYAGEHLDRSPAQGAALRDRYTAHYAAACERWEAELKGPRQLVALAEFEADLNNARAAWERAAEKRQIAQLGQAVDGLAIFHEWQGRYQEMASLCGTAIDTLSTHSPRTGLSERVHARVLAWQSYCFEQMGDLEAAGQQVRESSAILDQLEADPSGQVDCRAERALSLWAQGGCTWQQDPLQTQQAFEQSLTLSQSLGDRWCTGRALYYLSGMARWFMQWRRTDALARQSLTLFESLGDRRMAAAALYERAHAALGRHQLQDAEIMARNSLTGAERAGYQRAIVAASQILDWVYLAQGEYAKARAGAAKLAARCEELGITMRLVETNLLIVECDMHLGRYESAIALAQATLDQCQEENYEQYALESYGRLGRIALVYGDYEEARRWSLKGGDCGLAALGIAERGLGARSEAQRHIARGLRVMLDQQNLYETLFFLPAGALLLADRGQPALSVEIYALAMRYPSAAHSALIQDSVGSHIAAAAATLPPDVVSAAQERGRARDLWTTVEELLAELEEAPG